MRARSWFIPSAGAPRASEALADQIIPTGAGWGYSAGAIDPIDGDRGFRSVNTASRRQIPYWSREKARTYSVAAYRANPMARAIIDTYTAFCVGDSGMSLVCPVPNVRDVADRFWHDPVNGLHRQDRQDLFLRDHLLMGETALEVMVGQLTGVARISPIDTDRVIDVALDRGNPLRPSLLGINMGVGERAEKTVIQPDDLTGRRQGEVAWWISFQALVSDQRGDPFLSPILDWLDSYDQVISNLVDRTALMRHLAFDVEVTGGPEAVANFIKGRGGHHIPRSGTIEVHNESVKWNPIQGVTGAAEDSTTASNILTSVAAGAGLAKTWIAEPDGSNRATSLTMAEPIRRRVGAVQALWLEWNTELVRYAVDQAVGAGRLPVMVEAPMEGMAAREVPAAQTVTVNGPEVAAADANVTAVVLVNLAGALTEMVEGGILSKSAAQIAARKGWEQFAGVPYTADLDDPAADPADVATAIDDAQAKQQKKPKRTPVGLTPAQTLMGASQ